KLRSQNSQINIIPQKYNHIPYTTLFRSRYNIMSRKVTTIFLFFLLLIVPVHVAAASSPEEDLEEHFDELEESIDEITTIEMSVEQSNNSILNAIKERIFQAIFERSQIAQNISQSKVELNRTKETSIAIKGEINRIRS